MRFRGEIVAGLLCGLFAVLWIATALGLPYMGQYAPGSGFLPLWLGVCLLVLSTVHVVSCLRAPPAAVAAGHWRKVVAVMLGLVICVAVIEPVGFVVAVGVLVFSVSVAVGVFVFSVSVGEGVLLGSVRYWCSWV